jgi:hypothetical protein
VSVVPQPVGRPRLAADDRAATWLSFAAIAAGALVFAASVLGSRVLDAHHGLRPHPAVGSPVAAVAAVPEVEPTPAPARPLRLVRLRCAGAPTGTGCFTTEPGRQTPEPAAGMAFGTLSG